MGAPSSRHNATEAGSSPRFWVNATKAGEVGLSLRTTKWGKLVTRIHGPIGGEAERLASVLRAAIGTGGTQTNNNIELQGDHRETARAELERRGFKVKLSGG